MVEKIRRTGGQVNNIGLGFGIGKFKLIHIIIALASYLRLRFEVTTADLGVSKTFYLPAN